VKKITYLIFACLIACSTEKEQKNTPPTKSNSLDYYRIVEGKDEPIQGEQVQHGEVLVSYSDCSACHKLDKRSKGPAFIDIAKRYPYNQVYIDLLANKIISGGFGSWGNPIMDPHPDLKIEDAQAMAAYILSLENPGL
jgi:cytochrome c